jgi:hypothetical protein
LLPGVPELHVSEALAVAGVLLPAQEKPYEPPVQPLTVGSGMHTVEAFERQQ